MKQVTASALLFLLSASARSAPVEVVSPSGGVRFSADINGAGHLVYSLTLGGKPVIEESQLGITVGGADLGAGAALGQPARGSVNEAYPWWGGHSPAVDHCNTAAFPVTRGQQAWSLEVRAYDDGAAFRYVVPGSGSRTVSGEATQFRFPAATRVWTQDVANGYFYEKKYAASDIASVASGAAILVPLTAELPGGGYAAITEGNLQDFPGMHCVSRGGRVLQANFPEASWSASGDIASPWRVIMAAPDLNGLVNCDIVHNVCPPPTASLASADWIKPGLSAWSYLGSWGEGITPDQQKRYSRQASELGLPYNVVDANWETNWPNPFAALKDLCGYARPLGVNTMVVKRYSEMLTTAARRDWFKKLSDAGAAGVKIDFIDSEKRDAVAFYAGCLKDAAEFKQVVIFHGANKPTGLERTWPNEVSREAIRGLEYHRTGAWDQAGVIFPFTRMLAGHADYTPMNFAQSMGKISVANHIASVIAFTSPWTNLSEDPARMLTHPARGLIVSIPTAWDQTRVIAPSKIGDLLVFARRKGTAWWVAVISGSSSQRTVNLNLSFLPPGNYRLLAAEDNPGSATAVTVDSSRTVTPATNLSLVLRPIGGWAGRFVDPGQ